MSKLIEQVRALVARGEVLVSLHGAEELATDGIQVREVVNGLSASEAIEEYPDYAKGPCVLVLQRDASGQPIHVVWGIPMGQDSPAVLVTAYRPDSKKWDETWLKRRT